MNTIENYSDDDWSPTEPPKRPKHEKAKVIEPSTSGIPPPSYKVESLTSKKNLHEHQDEGSNDEEELELNEPSTSGIASNFYSVESSAPKKTLHGLTYQLRLLTLFVHRVPDEQEFYLATEMHEAGLFDDIVLKYPQNGIWRYRFLQAKHKNDDTYKIKEIDLFNKKSKSKNKSQSSKNVGETKPYLLKKYFDSYCVIKENTFFNNAELEEFLICTNVGFAENVLCYFESAEENDPILGDRVKYKLKQDQISKLRKEFDINNQNENYFSNFIKEFRFLPNYKDDKLNENIENCLKTCFKIENVDLANKYFQSCVLKWFETYQDMKSKYLRIKDKKEFLKILENNIDSLLVTGYSTFYIKELESYGVQFNDISLLRDHFAQKDNIMFIITATPKLSIIKLNQLFNELKLSQDEVILTNGDQLNCNEKISTTFFSEPSYKWLVIEYHHNEIVLDIKVLSKILEMDNSKAVVIIGREDHVLRFKKFLGLTMLPFYDKNSLFKDLTKASQETILKKQVVFQNKEVILNELININLGKNIIDELALEKLLTESIEIGNNDAFESDFLIEDYYIRRILIQRELKLVILQDEEVLESCVFIISGVNRDQLENLKICSELIFLWEDDKSFDKGIIISTIIDFKDIFNKLCKNNTKNVCWLEYIQGKFLIRNISHDTDILHKYIICLKEDELGNEQILEKKFIIVADGPGCGKSTFMTIVARQLTQNMYNVWALRLTLSSYAYKQKGQKHFAKSLEDIEFRDNEPNRAIEFIADLIFPQECENENKHFVKKLLIQSLHCSKKNMKFPKIILLFDGFDEVSPTFKKNTLTLLKALRNSNVAQIWITTRHHEEHSLEEALQSSSFFLKPLDVTEKVNFLENFWKYSMRNFANIKPKISDEDTLTYFKEIAHNLFRYSNYAVNNKFYHDLICYGLSRSSINSINFSSTAEHLLDYFENTYKDKILEFTGNLLQLKMIAEMYFFKKLDPLNDLDMFSVYDEFITYKWTVFRGDKGAAAQNVIGDEVFETHLEYLTTYHQNIAFKSLFRPHDHNQVKKESDKIILSRAGLLVIHNDRLEFVHRSFAEYFVSQYFAEHFQNENIQEIMFSEVLIKKNYSIIRGFLNRNTTFLDKLSTKTGIKVIEFDSKILYQMLKEDLYNLFVKYLENLPPDFSKNAILFSGNADGKTVLHRICECREDGKIVENILKAVKDSVSFDTLIELFFKKDNKQRTALNCINFAGITSRTQKFQFFKLNCPSNLFYNLLLQANDKGQTILHRTYKYGHDISSLLEVIDENRNVIRKILLKTDDKGRTALFNSIFYPTNASMLIKLLKLVDSVCNSEEIKYLVTIKSDSRNLLHIVCNQTDQNFLVHFLNTIKDYKGMFEEFLLDTDRLGFSPLHCTMLVFINFYRLKILLDFVNSNCNTKTLYTVLCKKTFFGATVLHLAMASFEKIYNHDSFTPLLTYLFNLLKNNKEIFEELLLSRDCKGQTVLHYSSSKEKISEYPFLVKELLDFAQANCSLKIFGELLLTLDKNKYNILHCICEQYDEHNLTFLLDKIKDKPDIVNELLIKTNNGYNSLQYTAASLDNPSCLKILYDFIKTYASEKLDELLIKESDTGCSLLHLACGRNTEDNLKYLLDAIQDNIAIRDDLILKGDNNGQTVLHYSVCKFQMLKLLLDFVKSNCRKETFTILILKCDKEGRTGLHILCEIGDNKEILTYFLNLVKDNTTPEAFNTFLSKKDRNENVASVCIARNNPALLQVLNFDIQS